MIEIAVASPAEAAGIAGLIDRCQASDGTGLAQRFSVKEVEAHIAAMPCIVARDGRAIMGVLLAQPLELAADAGPVTRAMLAAYPGSPDSYVYGPIAVAPEARGQGVAVRMARALEASTAGREGILFINETNAASLATHERLGYRLRASFGFGSNRFAVLTTR